jgi:serine/threonine protein kinase
MDIQTFADFKLRYKFDEGQAVGSGGFAAVYKGLDSLTGRTVAIKKSLVNPDRQRYSLYEEVQMGKALQHPNLVEYLDVYRFSSDHGTFDYGVLEFVNGGTLSDFLRTEPSQPQVKAVLLGVLEGLKFLHDKGIIHRDLKPANVLIHYEGGRYVPKIIDFGISKALSSDESTVSNIVGSWQYMSPEQISPLPGVKIRTNSDLWSFGVIVYEMFTGRAAFGSTKSGDTQERIRGRILDGKLPEDVATIPHPYQNVIRTCLVKHPDHRAAKAEHLIHIINTYGQQEVTISSQKTEVASVPPPVVKAPAIPPQPQPLQVHPVQQPYALPSNAASQAPSREPGWLMPAIIMTCIALMAAFFLPLISQFSESSAFAMVKSVFTNSYVMDSMDAEAWVLVAAYLGTIVSGALILLAGVGRLKGLFVLGMTLLGGSVAYISYQYFRVGSFSDSIASMGLGFWIPVVGFVALLVMRFMGAKRRTPGSVREPRAAQAFQPASEPVVRSSAPQAPAVRTAPRRSRRFPTLLLVLLLILGGLGATGWFLTEGFSRLPFAEKSKKELIIGKWKMYQVFEDYEYKELDAEDQIIVEFKRNGKVEASGGEINDYRVQGDYLLLDGEPRLEIKSLDNQNLRLADEAGTSEMSFRRL